MVNHAPLTTSYRCSHGVGDSCINSAGLGAARRLPMPEWQDQAILHFLDLRQIGQVLLLRQFVLRQEGWRRMLLQSEADQEILLREAKR
jgi:hypothetical protein